eukprot:6503233-Prymnesium_polylepis.1
MASERSLAGKGSQHVNGVARWRCCDTRPDGRRRRQSARARERESARARERRCAGRMAVWIFEHGICDLTARILRRTPGDSTPLPLYCP